MVLDGIAAVGQGLPLRTLVALVVALASVVVVRRVVGRPLTAGLRGRLLFGVPWGTLLTAVALLLIYAVVQGGWANPRDPLVLPFRTWGYDYLLGTLAAAFTHNGWSHVMGNVTATLAFAGVAEYAIGHYPRERGVATFSSLRTNPYARIFVIPVAAVVVGIFTSLTGLGPLIGFSGVIFAFAGFAIIQAPIAATLALVGVEILDLLRLVIQDPERPASVFQTTITPWWAEVAIQTHGVGLLVGLLAGMAYAHHRGEWENPVYVWFAALVFAVEQGLWAIFVPLTGSSWLLFRWVGVALVFVLAALAAVAVAGADRTLVGRIGLHRRELAVGLLLVGLAGMSLAAIPFHVAAVGDEPAPNGVVEVNSYTVGYGENVPEGYVNAVSLPYGEMPTVESSGVIVTNPDRNMWRLAITKERLENSGDGSVLIGGLGWRERVYANWVGWRVVGNDSVYKVFLARSDGDWRQAFASNASTSETVVAGYNLTLAPTADGFAVRARAGDRRRGPVAIPGNGSSAQLGTVTLEREGRRLIAVHDGTRVRLATRTERAESE